jgi:hypothetical protein
VESIDMSPVDSVSEELVAYGAAIGVTVVDARAPLAGAEPGAFLYGDIHMTPKGHAAVAVALAEGIAGGQPKRVDARSPVPVPSVYAAVREAIVAGSTAAGCETKQVREWLRVLCARTGSIAPPVAVTIDRDDGGEAMSLVMPHGVSLVVPIVAGREFAATIAWPDATRAFHVTWADGKPTLAFDQPVKVKPAKRAGDEQLSSRVNIDSKMFVSPFERTVCDCWNRVHGGIRDTHDDTFQCTGVYGATAPACALRYHAGPRPDTKHDTVRFTPAQYTDEERGQCEQLLACIRRDPGSPP